MSRKIFFQKCISFCIVNLGKQNKTKHHCVSLNILSSVGSIEISNFKKIAVIAPKENRIICEIDSSAAGLISYHLNWRELTKMSNPVKIFSLTLQFLRTDKSIDLP